MAYYGLSSWIVAALQPAEAIAAIAAAGFRSVELSDDQAPLVRAWEADPVSVTADLAAAGLTLSSVHSPMNGRFLDLADTRDRLLSVDADLEYLELMAACGVPEMVLHPISAWQTPPAADLSAFRADIVDSLSRIAARAAALDLRLAVENLGGISASMTGVLDLIAGFEAHVGLCLDVGHAVQNGLDPFVEVGTALDSGRLFSLHLHDVDEAGVDHFLPGEGDVALDTIMAELDHRCFTGLRTLEIARAEDDVATRVLQAGQVRARWEMAP